LEDEWERPSTFDAGDVAEERTMLVKSGVQPAATESPPKLGSTRGKPRTSIEKESTSFGLRGRHKYNNTPDSFKKLK